MVDERSERLSAGIEGLAAALRASGVDPDAAARLLGSAGKAVLQALTLDLLHERPQPAPRPAPVLEPVLPEPERAPDVPLAA